jgi:MinD-like ATPase involved in chromosome partitioning or flagellar assembly
MALVNSAVQLAQTGRKVLIVDFDLEAPGIDSFSLPKATDKKDGIVEYVTNYLKSDVAPDVRDYAFEASSMGARGGSLWIMPAGRQDSGYSSRLNAIDWKNLYEQHSGYLLFEDLKAQWEKRLKVDYVFIDSRTGHTDVGGICTRQLPDSVVLLFVPNAQNLRGLEKVVSDIRAEKVGSRSKNIELLFVVSNIPDIDDEKQILERRLEEFKKTLKYPSLAATIHKYDSLDLLDQVVFVKDRPRASLTHEYKKLVDQIVTRNAKDKEGALQLLQNLRRGSYWQENRLSHLEVDAKLDKIHLAHPKDAQVLTALAHANRRRGKLTEVISLLDEAGDEALSSPESLLMRAECQQLLGHSEKAASDISSLLKCKNVSSESLTSAIEVLYQVNPDGLSEVVNSPAIAGSDVETRIGIAAILARRSPLLKDVINVLESCLADQKISREDREHAQLELVLAYVGLREFKRAMTIISREPHPDPRSFDITQAFNFAMALWGHSKNVPVEYFKRVVELQGPDVESQVAPNYAQCLSVANWAVGHLEQARNWAKVSRESVPHSHGYEFSCWRYAYTTRDEFSKDVSALQKMIDGAAIKPSFMRRSKSN